MRSSSGRYRFVWVADPKHRETVIRLLHLEDAKAAESPGTKETGKSRDADEELHGEEASTMQSVAGTLNYLALDRPDIMYASKCIMAEIGKPTRLCEARAKRCARYLIKVEAVEWHFPLQGVPAEIYIEVDSDLAGDQRESRPRAR